MKKIASFSIFVFLVAALSYSCANSSKKSENKEISLDEIENVKEDLSPGIIFSDLSFSDALKKAKKTNKLVFVDAYTTWCGPCKMLTKNTFPDPSVGAYFNEKFINLKVEVEKHPFGRTLQSKYGVSAYPTMFWVDGDGVLVKKVVGYRTPEQMLREVPAN